MSTSKHIYNADSEYPHTVILNHGGSETTVLYDSDDDNTTEQQKEIEHRRRLQWWGKVLTKKYEDNLPKESWLPDALQRAKDAGDI